MGQSEYFTRPGISVEYPPGSNVWVYVLQFVHLKDVLNEDIVISSSQKPPEEVIPCYSMLFHVRAEETDAEHRPAEQVHPGSRRGFLELNPF